MQKNKLITKNFIENMRHSFSKPKRDSFRVMMIGPDINGRGGVSSVVQGYKKEGLMERLNIDYFQSTKQGKKIFKLLYYIKALFIILIKMPNYHLIHIHTASRWSFRRKSLLVIIAKLFGKKSIIHLHGAEFDKYYTLSCWYEKFIIRFVFYITDKVIVLSNEWIKKVISFCEAKKIAVIHNSITIVPFEQNQNIKTITPKIVLFLGELGSRKGVFDLLDAIKLLKIGNEKVLFLLHGNGEIDKVRQIVKVLELESFVKVPGWISGEEKDNLLKRAYLFVLPSYNEGLPMSILESLSYGVPVISTPVGGIPSAIINGFNGLLVSVNSPKELSQAIQKLLDDVCMWKTFSENAYYIAKEKFSMEYHEHKLVNLYSILRQN